jgi:two-component sensor histidine kinase
MLDFEDALTRGRSGGIGQKNVPRRGAPAARFGVKTHGFELVGTRRIESKANRVEGYDHRLAIFVKCRGLPKTRHFAAVKCASREQQHEAAKGGKSVSHIFFQKKETQKYAEPAPVKSNEPNRVSLPNNQPRLLRNMSDIYRRKSHWKWYLAAAAVAIVSITLWYTKYLADRLSEREDQQATQFAEALRSLAKSNLTIGSEQCDMELHLKIISQNTTVPVVLFDDGWNILEYQNIGDNSIKEMDTTLVRQALNQMVNTWSDTIEVSVPPYFRQYLVYSHSNLLVWLRWYPILQLLLIGAFVGLGYLGFSASRRARENQVWLGMAKETAHQLGTPLTAIMGWVETLKSVHENDPVTTEMLDEMGNDVKRLELVSDRFSKIGAKPELATDNLYAALERCRAYMQRRAPRRVTFEFPDPDTQPSIAVRINAHLFDWVVENLLRNSIDALETGEGGIRVDVYREGRWACFDLSDTGKGIASSKHKTVFQPGYSTKTRGWGLGLSLSKRIVEQYHGGRIFVKKSELGKGTTFTVKLPA